MFHSVELFTIGHFACPSIDSLSTCVSFLSVSESVSVCLSVNTYFHK